MTAGDAFYFCFPRDAPKMDDAAAPDEDSSESIKLRNQRNQKN